MKTVVKILTEVETCSLAQPNSASTFTTHSTPAYTFYESTTQHLRFLENILRICSGNYYTVFISLFMR